jgi:hypothetical protein
VTGFFLTGKRKIVFNTAGLTLRGTAVSAHKPLPVPFFPRHLMDGLVGGIKPPQAYQLGNREVILLGFAEEFNPIGQLV